MKYDGVEDIAGDESVIARAASTTSRPRPSPRLMPATSPHRRISRIGGIRSRTTRRERIRNAGFSGVDARKPVGFENFQRGQRGRAADGIGRVTMSVVEGVFRTAQEQSSKISFVASVAASGTVPPVRPFRQAEEIRDHVLPLAGEHRPGATEAGHDLVQYEVDTVFRGPLPESREHALPATVASR